MKAASPAMGLPPFDAATITGREMRDVDWAATSLGPVAGWDPALPATIRMMLACPRPMFLAWGPDLLCFYNDAYRPILGYRLATSLGRPFREVWASIWNDIAPLVETTLAGHSRTLTNLPLDLARGGEPEESWWSFTYSPVFDGSGVVAGLVCITEETTAQVRSEERRRLADERLDLALSAGQSIGAWDWDVPTGMVTADARFALLYGVDPAKAAAGVPIIEFFAGIHPGDRDRIEGHIAEAVRTGEPFAQEYRLLDEGGAVRWVTAQGRCALAPDGSPMHFPGVSFDITARKAAEEALRTEQDRFRAITNSIDHMIWSTPSDGFHDFYNARWYEYTGVPDGSTDGEGWSDLVHREDQERAWAVWRHCLDTGEPYRIEYRLRNRSGQYRWVLGRAQAVRNEAGAITRWFGTCTDIQEIVDAREVLARSREELEKAVEERTAELMVTEEKLRQSQKMEAVGQLTGGIAHDFNNMLAIVIGGLNLTQRRLARGDLQVGKYIDSAMEGATRAAALTQRLLAFSRQQPLSPEPVDGNAMLAGLHEFLTRTLGERIRLETVLGAGLWRAKADANQLENVLINLAVNARDAMPDGGRLTVETANAHVDEDYGREVDIVPGQYVLFAVTDTGTGIAPDVIERIFDPFFTTKEVGKGTGLGLSQVFGFLRQSGGHVKVYSEVGHGTTFKVYLPRDYGRVPVQPARRVSSGVTGGDRAEIILVVEDEDRVRNLSVEALRELGYTVLHAGSGRDALALVEGGQEITLLFTDVVMPEMTGRELADRVRALRPGIRILYTTGYTRNAVVHNGVIDPGTNFLAKPFGIDQLAAKIRDVLDA